MEMVLTPVSNTPTAESHLQPVLTSKAAVTHPEKTTPSPSAPAVQAHTASTSNDAVPATATTASTSRAQAMPALTLPSSEAQGLNNPQPVYPKLSRRLNEQGQVVIRVYVGADGSAQQGEIKTSSGYDRLDQEALRTVLRWRFVPGQRLGTPEAMWFNVPVNFVLE
jgi:protein TonB